MMHSGRLARRHFQRIAELLLRADGSVYQVVWFDDATGKPQFLENWQGDKPDGVWSRGQAWGILGFAQAWQYTKHQQYRTYAEQLVQYFVQHLNPDDTVPWDFSSDRKDILDTSAAVIALTGMGILQIFPQVARRMWAALDPFIAPKNKDGLLDGATFFKRRGWGVMEPCAWGDFFLLESWTLWNVDEHRVESTSVQ